ncbi:hypothetical protein FJO69_00030 [[Mycoplasma] falconis]|uniref:Uncharacterized protein n=1 Tax=[Mycoplasma] falconis TaxID=92403 RepID=A0A501XBQ7_9BACT|nr:hypothetical protein [[Mycoplasma] falconis]TPE57991.1 hypothetical protein FJO69_00030 [[Mycoplasma] falconis]
MDSLIDYYYKDFKLFYKQGYNDKMFKFEERMRKDAYTVSEIIHLTGENDYNYKVANLLNRIKNRTEAIRLPKILKKNDRIEFLKRLNNEIENRINIVMKNNPEFVENWNNIVKGEIKLSEKKAEIFEKIYFLYLIKKYCRPTYIAKDFNEIEKEG